MHEVSCLVLEGLRDRTCRETRLEYKIQSRNTVKYRANTKGQVEEHRSKENLE